ncbi:hypothetical protein BCL57_001611 [Agromyces flavus]|uniref:DUF2510 domain-containing protein n=1 Tax=Agromyces flavus TaxID=589382 RepID=A0A1H1L8K7_9MICO|nr:DUF2510 domain-containing protein [Agromyces flavus]MCP2367457.1 hypothetical protein [Agromyces flavus]GGI45693.1 hypothetical protein GCM10010932_10830 [Agromyces flavus]SDR70395.1 Protein of unknown function [Agromyces flavus]
MTGAARRPPGWYDDATDAALQRYWDGSGWTPHTSTRGPASLVAPAEAEAEPVTLGVAGAAAPRHPLEALGLESTRRLGAPTNVSMGTPTSAAPDHTTVPTPARNSGPSMSALPAALGPSPRIWFVAAAGAITAAASLVVAFAALGVALGR